MSREVRRVPPDWQHPTEFNKYSYVVQFKPLFEGPWEARAARWDEDSEHWLKGEERDSKTYFDEVSKWVPADPQDLIDYPTWLEYNRERPVPEEYMPSWTSEEATHYMMYESTSEGTPISPAFASPEELAHWLADTGASTFADLTATYEQWLVICKGASAPSMIFSPETGVISGVEAAAIWNEEES